MKTLTSGRLLQRFSIVFLVALAACTPTRQKFVAAAPVAGQGVEIELSSARGSRNKLRLSFKVKNSLSSVLTFNRNQVAVVAPDGLEYYSINRRPMTTIKPGDSGNIRFTVEVGKLNLGVVKGLYLRFDGVWADKKRVAVEPMALGEPSTGPGDTKPDIELASAHVNTKGNDSITAEDSQPASRCAVLRLRGTDVPEAVTTVVDELLLTELQNAGFEAIGPDDINAIVGFEAAKQAVGCDDASCMTEIGNALGVPYLVAGNLAKLDSDTVLTLKLINVRDTRVVARVNRIAARNNRDLPQMIADSVLELVERAGL